MKLVEKRILHVGFILAFLLVSCGIDESAGKIEGETEPPIVACCCEGPPAIQKVSGILFLLPNEFASGGELEYEFDSHGNVTYWGYVRYFGDDSSLSSFLPEIKREFSGKYKVDPSILQSQSYRREGAEFIQDAISFLVDSASHQGFSTVKFSDERGMVEGTAVFDLTAPERLVTIESIHATMEIFGVVVGLELQAPRPFCGTK